MAKNPTKSCAELRAGFFVAKDISRLNYPIDNGVEIVYYFIMTLQTIVIPQTNVRVAIPVEEPDEQETGICNSCGDELAPIYENNGYTMPEGPEHWEVVGFKPCPCSLSDDDGGDE